MKSKILWLLLIEYLNYGRNSNNRLITLLFDTEEDAKEKLYEYVAEDWKNIEEDLEEMEEDVVIPKDKDEAISIYFECQEDENWDIIPSVYYYRAT